MSSVAKTTTQRLDQWKAESGQYDYAIMHIAGDRKCLGDLLSRWVTVPSVSVRASAVYAASEPDETLPCKQAIRDGQQASRANLGTLASVATSLITDDGQVTLNDEGLFRLQVNGRAVLWIPRAVDGVCSHEGGWPSWCCSNRPAAIAILLLVSHGGARHQVRQCLHCMDFEAGEKVPLPLGATVHGTRPGEVVHFVYPYVGASGRLGDDLDEDGGYSYILVMMGDMIKLSVA